MALHIRDFRPGDAAELSQLSETARRLGAPPPPGPEGRILAARRDARLTGAIWFTLKGETGLLSSILVAQTEGWRSDVQELIAEASLWLISRGAAHIDLMPVPADEALFARLREMHFKPDPITGTMTRCVPARSAA